MKFHYSLVICFLISTFGYAQIDSIPRNHQKLHTWIDSELNKGLSDYNIPAISFSLIQNDSISYTKGYGVENAGSTVMVSDSASVFHIASISKSFVAVAVMQLVEQNRLNLDSNINMYLNTFKIDFKGEPITITHLLQHTAGFDERNLYTTVLSFDEVISLESHLKLRMPPQIREAGDSFTYSNYGFALLAHIVENVSGVDFNEYVSKNILNPLEMYSSGFKKQSKLKYVPSYLQIQNELKPYKFDYPLNYPAASFSTTASDMRNYLKFILNDGTFNEQQLLSKKSMSLLLNSEFKHFPEATNGYAFGFFTSNYKGYNRVGHTGVKQGFASDLTLIPEKDIGFFLCVNASKYPNSNTRKFMNDFIRKLLNKLVPENFEEETKQVIANKKPKDLSVFEGDYRFTRYAQTTLDKLGVLIGLAPEIKVIAKGGKLTIPAWDLELDYINNSTFYDFKNEKHISFGIKENGKVNYLFSSGTSAYHKLKWYENIFFQIKWIGVITVVMVLSLIIGLLGLLLIKKRKYNRIRRIQLGIAITIIVGLTLLGYVLITTDPQQFVYGVPKLLKIALVMPFITILLQGFGLKNLFTIWREKQMNNYAFAYHAIVLLISIGIIPWWLYWNLLGFQY